MHANRIVSLALVLGAVILGEAWGGTLAGQGRLSMNLGLAHERMGQYKDAIDDFTQALASKALSPSDRVRAIFDRGVALDALGRTSDAVRDYSEAVRLDPHFAPALNNRANAYRRQAKLAPAKRDYMMALASSNAAREYPYFGLGQIAQEQGDAETARDYYRKALAANPAYALAAQSLAALGRIAERASIQLHRPAAKSAAAAPAEVLAQTQADARPAMAVHLISPKPQLSKPERSAPMQALPIATAPAPSAKPVHIAPSAPMQIAANGSGPILRQTIYDSGTKRTPASSTAQIQLGAFRDEGSATEGWNKIATQSVGALNGLSPRIETIDLPGKGHFWRLRTDVVDKATGRKLCASLASRGLACMVVRD